jgi:hypothetical protein
MVFGEVNDRDALAHQDGQDLAEGGIAAGEFRAIRRPVMLLWPLEGVDSRSVALGNTGMD